MLKTAAPVLKIPTFNPTFSAHGRPPVQVNV